MPGSVSPGAGFDGEIVESGGQSDGHISADERAALVRAGALILRLKPGYAWPLITDDEDELLAAAARLIAEPESMADAAERGQLYKALVEHAAAPTRRLVRSVRPSAYYDNEKLAVDTDLPPAASLSQYWRMDVRELTHAQRIEVMLRLRALSAVELVYIEGEVRSPATVDPLTSSSTGCVSTSTDGQCYVEGGDKGINARGAWDLGVTGAGVRIVDVERTWYESHDDLPVIAPAAVAGSPTATGTDLLSGNNAFSPLGAADFDGRHGAAVAGILVARQNGVGVQGIAHGATLKLASHYQAPDLDTAHVADAIMAALTWLSAGDVLLLEIERKFTSGALSGFFGPTEIDAADHDAIRVAHALGVIVVEAAGNSGQDLDKVPALKVGDSACAHSGAIVVGACSPGLPTTATGTPSHTRLPASNFGSRVDCFAWGARVATVGVATSGTTTFVPSTATDTAHAYRADFDGTSAAAAIIAGAAALVSSRHSAVFGGQPPAPAQLRELLRDPDLGVQCTDHADGNNIGSMPDVVQVFGSLGLVGDVYVRDTVADSGAVPSSGIACRSPDIIVRQAAYTGDPDDEIGEGSGHEDDELLSQPVLTGAAHAVYVRVRNRGAAPVTGVKATVYYAQGSTLLAPADWTLIGTTAGRDVPDGDTTVVLGPLSWPAAPPTGHYCFIALVGGVEDPAPELPRLSTTTLTWQNFLAMVQENNNVAWRNFDVVPLVSGTASVSFFLRGAADRKRPFRVEIHADLRWDQRLSLEFDPRLLEALGHIGRPDLFGQRRAILLNPRGVRVLPTLWMGPRDRIPLRLTVSGGGGKASLKGRHRRPTGEVSVRQLYGGVEVGRVTFRFED